MVGSLNSTEEDSLLHAWEPSSPEIKRWWMLFWFAYVAALQSLLWFTYSSVPDHARVFLNVTGDDTLNLLLNEGPIAFVATVFFAAWILAKPKGLKMAVMIGSGLCFAGACIRSIPLFWTENDRYKYSKHLLIFVHVGQTLNAAAAPFVVASVSQLSLVWFPENERNKATACANVASAAGRAIGFFIGPAMVSSAADMPLFLIVEIVIAAIPVVCIFAYYPSEPKLPPSKAAAELRHKYSCQSHGLINSIKMAFEGAGTMLSSFSFVILILSGGLSMGVYGLWSGVLTEVLPSSWSDQLKGDFGLVNTVCSVAGGLFGGFITDLPSLQKRLKSVSIISMALATALFFGFAANFFPLHFFHFKGEALLFSICATAGFTRGIVDPLYFEMSADIAHPHPASTAGSILTLVYHVVLVISLSIPSGILAKWALTATAFVMLACTLLLTITQMKYPRR
eukprot:m.346798 g.346798  ORF g.346798 m.346798 type:complete len:453 (+) comp30398_c0_seq1:59-1417(+)